MPSKACQQLSRLAAILAVALLCAQTLVIAHEHEPLDDGLCAVCSTASVAAASGEPLPPPTESASRPPATNSNLSARLQDRYSQLKPRAPPIA